MGIKQTAVPGVGLENLGVIESSASSRRGFLADPPPFPLPSKRRGRLHEALAGPSGRWRGACRTSLLRPFGGGQVGLPDMEKDPPGELLEFLSRYSLPVVDLFLACLSLME